VSFVFLPLLVFLGIVYFLVREALGVLESESESLVPSCVEESESDELLMSGIMNFGFFRP
jgi:hypothetical protein